MLKHKDSRQTEDYDDYDDFDDSQVDRKKVAKRAVKKPVRGKGKQDVMSRQLKTEQDRAGVDSDHKVSRLPLYVNLFLLAVSLVICVLFIMTTGFSHPWLLAIILVCIVGIIYSTFVAYNFISYGHKLENNEATVTKRKVVKRKAIKQRVVAKDQDVEDTVSVNAHGHRVIHHADDVADLEPKKRN